jgi:TnpA family transposase
MIWIGEYMGRRKLLKQEEWEKVFGIPDEESLIRHYTLTPEDRLEIETRRRSHNQLGYAVQLCLMRYPGRTLMPGEQLPSSVVGYISEQLAVDRPRLGVSAGSSRIIRGV